MHAGLTDSRSVKKILTSLTADERDTDLAENSFTENGGTMINDTTLEENVSDVSPPRSVTGISLLCFHFEGQYRVRTQA
jgi:hypothetical protein